MEQNVQLFLKQIIVNYHDYKLDLKHLKKLKLV